MKIEKGLTYISIIIILITINIFLAYKIILSDMAREQLIWLFFMVINTTLMVYIRKLVEREIRIGYNTKHEGM